jgi:type I restriction enzyme S subunit
MKKGWITKPLGDLCEVFTDGNWIESKDQSSEGIRLIQTGNVGQGVFKDRGDKARYISEATFKRLRCTEIFEGDCLVSRLPDPVGRSCILPDTGERMITAVDCTILRFDTKQFLPEFFNYYSQSDDYISTVANECTGTTRNRISRSNLGLTPIPVPPLPEQRRIVGILDEAFAGLATAKANAEKNLHNARALFESHLQSVFSQRGKGWVEKKVSEIAKHSLGKMLDKAKNKGEPQPYLRNINVRWFTFDLSNTLEMPFLPSEVEKYTAIKGDVLICEGGYPGRAAIWSEDNPIYFQKALHRVRFHEPEHNKWFVYYLSAQDSNGELKQHFSGTGIQHFTGEVLARFTIPVPPLPELRRAVAKFDSLSSETQRLAAIYQQKLTALEALKKSLLHQAFSGEL